MAGLSTLSTELRATRCDDDDDDDDDDALYVKKQFSIFFPFPPSFRVLVGVVGKKGAILMLRTKLVISTSATLL